MGITRPRPDGGVIIGKNQLHACILWTQRLFEVQYQI